MGRGSPLENGLASVMQDEQLPAERTHCHGIAGAHVGRMSLPYETDH